MVVVVITGGTGGIGYQTALALAKKEGFVVCVTGRSRESGEKAVASLKLESKNDNVHLALADLSLQSGVRALAADLLARFPAIDCLINNAGNLALGTTHPRTAEGVDQDPAVNVIAPPRLTNLLLPSLKAATSATVQFVSGTHPIFFYFPSPSSSLLPSLSPPVT
jgi:NAD(P)-dependent dehydrogenase (short-subunit alcohol dehydrogenase family)